MAWRPSREAMRRICCSRSARVRALLRRAAPERLADVLSFGELEVDREKKRVSRAGRAIDLGPTEYRLLEFLMERPSHVNRQMRWFIPSSRTVRGAGYALDDRFGKMG